MISDKDIKNYHKWQEKLRNHQKSMYESENIFERWFQNKRRGVIKSLIRELNPSSLLDVGCAEGIFTRFLSETRECSVGVDISESKLKRAKVFTKDNSVSYLLADASALPFSDNSFDMVVCTDTIRYITNPIKAAKELFRVSKKYIQIESATTKPLKNSSEFISIDSGLVKNSFQSNSFAGALWTVTPRALKELKYLRSDIKIIKQIATNPFLSLIPNIFPRSRRADLFEKIIPLLDIINDFLAEKPFFNKLGLSTTILFEKKQI